MIYRCPVCFAREIDVILHKAGEQYYCTKCSFTGNEDCVLEMYEDLKKKYRFINTRITLDDLESRFV